MSDIVKKMADLILKSQKSIATIAQASGLSRQMIYKVLKKEVDSLSTNTISALCKAIDVPDSILFEKLTHTPLERKTISEKLRELRRARKLTQVELGKVLNVSNGTVAMWETDKRSPNIDMIVKISNFFDIPPSYLLTNTDLSESFSSERNAIASIGDKLKSLRREKTQKETAEKIGISYACYNKYETANIMPDIETLIKIADYFHITVDELIGHEVPFLINKATLSQAQSELFNSILNLSDEDCKYTLSFIAGLLLRHKK